MPTVAFLAVILAVALVAAAAGRAGADPMAPLDRPPELPDFKYLLRRPNALEYAVEVLRSEKREMKKSLYRMELLLRKVFHGALRKRPLRRVTSPCPAPTFAHLFA